MMKSFSIYRLSDGTFTGAVYTVPESDIARNTPEGHGAAEGSFDHLSQRFDLERGEAVDWQPPQPSSNHEWNEVTRRWQLTAAAQAQVDADRLARLELMSADLGAIRALIDHVLGDPDAKSRLEAIQFLKAQKRQGVVQRD